MSVSWIDVVGPIAVAIIIIAVNIYLFSPTATVPTPLRSLRFCKGNLSDGPHHFVSDTDLEQILLFSLNLGLGVIKLEPLCDQRPRLCKYATIIFVNA